MGALAYRPLRAAQTAPALSIAEVPAQPGETVSLAIGFSGGGHAIASTAFSIDYDEGCLAFDPADGDGDGLADAITFTLPTAFVASATADAADNDGELDILVADFSLPLAGLPDGPIASVAFRVTCQPAAETPQRAAVRFAASPAVSFGNTGGSSVAGSTVDGAVLVSAPTATPTATATPTDTATPTTQHADHANATTRPRRRPSPRPRRCRLRSVCPT